MSSSIFYNERTGNKMSHSKRIYAVTASMLALILISAPAKAQLSGNVLINSGFEDDEMSSYGDHVYVNLNNQPTGWSFGVDGDDPNIVKVDGPGGQADWYYSGPESDATASGAGVDRQYLDIYGGSNDFYQVFTPECSGEVLFGGYFSTRQNDTTTSSVRILNGAGLTGTVVDQTNTLTLPSGNSVSDPWVPVDYSTSVTANQTYSFVVTMDNNSNFDEAYVKFTTGCSDVYPPDGTPDGTSTGTGTPDDGGGIDGTWTGTAGVLGNDSMAEVMSPDFPYERPNLPNCCSPWDEVMLQESLKYEGTGNITDPYTLRYSPTASINTQMEAYINYLNALDPSVTSITVHFRLWDKGQTPSSPGLGSQLGNDHYVTWTAGGSSAPSNGGGNFFNLPAQGMNINNWYRVTSGVYLNDDIEAFGDDCANNELLMNIQVQGSALSTVGSSGGIGSVSLNIFKNGRVQSKVINTQSSQVKPKEIKRGTVLKPRIKR